MRRISVPLAPRRLRWGAVAVVAAAIFVASVLVDPGDAGQGTLGPHWDKILHAGAYAVLALVLAYATADWRRHAARRALAVLVATVGYGALVELAQTLVPYRQFSTLDLVANGAGALAVLGWVALETRLRYRHVDRGDRGSGPQSRREE